MQSMLHVEWVALRQVEGGTVTLKPSALPFVHADGLTVHFSVDPSDKPMLTNVAQTQRRIYTMVTVKLLNRSADGDSSDDGAAIVLRQYSYVREFGEWSAPTAPEKRRFDLQSDTPCRFDLVTRDGSVALELQVPAGAGDLQVDYYLVKKAVVNIHMAELLQHFFHSLRPTRALPTFATHFRTECVISVRGVE